MSILSRMANYLTLALCILVSTIIAKAVPICKEQLNYTQSTNGDRNAVLIQSGSLVDTSNVFVFTISSKPENTMTLILDKPVYITGIGIRQRFNKTEVGNECLSSLHEDPWASYNITYTGANSDTQRTLDYPPGVCMGIINPSTMLPYQNIPNKELYKDMITVALIPTIMRTITIEKNIVQEHEQIFNSGTYCLQFVLYGCEPTADPIELDTIVLEYQMYQPLPLPGYTESSDSSYSGQCSEGTCTGGTGKLTDKQIEFSSYNVQGMFVLWELSPPVLSVAGRSLSVMKMLLILDDVYFIEVVKIYGTTKIDGNSDISAPSFVTINGITVDTSGRVKIGDSYIIYLFPFIKTNAIQLQFYVDAEYNVTQRIAFSEISIEESYHHSYCNEQQYSLDTALIAVIVIAVILFVLSLTSLGINLYLIILYCIKKKPANKTYYVTHQTSENNNYTRTISTDIQLERLDTNYESIEFDVSNANNEYCNHKLPMQEYSKIPAKTSRPDSIIVMPPNPTYVASFPLSPIEEVPGYSHLLHSADNAIKRHSSVESNTLPRVREKSVTAAERRKSYSDQHDLSDLK